MKKILVLSAYNLIPSKDKKIIHGIGMGHSVYGHFYRQLKDWELKEEKTCIRP